MPTSAKHFVTLSTPAEGDLRILKGENPPKLTDGFGGWSVTDRPHRVGLTTWAGISPLRLTIPVVFEGWGEGAGQDIRISKLERMAMSPGANLDPPIISLSGSGIPNRGVTRWVIESLDWGDDIIWDFTDNGSMSRMRQDCVINLIQYVAPDRVAFSKLPNAQPGGGSWPKHHTWRKGHDTLQRLAAKYYHNAKKWKRIALANHIRDQKSIANKRVLRIPHP